MTENFLLNDKNRKLGRQILAYTTLFAITALLTYALFIVVPRTFLSNADSDIDGIAQQYPIYSEIKRMIGAWLAGDGLQMWSWDIGLGADTLREFNTKLLNPLTYLVIAFPQKYLDVGFTLVVLIEQYLSGLMFLLFGREIGLNSRQNVIGGICYAFCGWIMQSVLRQGTFLMATILLPLIILGVERILKGKSPVLFIVSVALHIIYSIQWAYVAAITVLIYFIVRYFTEYNSPADGDSDARKSGFGLTLVKFCGFGIVGILMSSAVLIGSLIKTTGATIESTVESEALYSLAQYFRVPAGFFLMNITSEAYTVYGLSIICIILLPFVVKGIKRRSTASIMACGLFLLSLLPVTGRIFNGFSYSVGRWFYVLAFFMVWAAMENYRSETFEDKRNIRTMTIWLTALAAWGLIVCWLLFGIIDKDKAAAIAAGAVLGALLISCLGRGYLKKGAKYEVIVTALIVCSIVGYVNATLFPGLGGKIHSLCRVGKIEEEFADSTQKVGQMVQAEDGSFYRIDQVDGYTDTRVARVRANENMYFGNRSIYTYLSTMSSSWHYFNKMLGNNAGYFDRTTSYSNDNREGLDFLMGVKYFLGDSETKKPGASDYAAYGFEKHEKTDGVEVLKNKYCMGIGTVYNSYITESELMEYSPLEREQVLLQAAVIRDKDADKINKVHHADKSDIRTDVQSVDVSIENRKNIEIEEHSLKVTGRKGGSFDIRLPEIKNCRIVVAFEGLNRETCSYDERLELRGKKFKGSALKKFIKTVSYDDNEKFSIEVSKGNVVKEAQMRKGKNQGFSDVTDFYINAGYYDTISGDLHVSLSKYGIYDYNAIKVYAVPMDIYDEAAGELEAKSLRTDSWSNESFSGTMTADRDGGIMYFSILNNRGWDIYVDGEKQNKLDAVNLSFTGAELSAGEHKVELRYKTPYLVTGMLMSMAGLLATVAIAIYYRRRKTD
ncbi:MAG: YfhO family protein [Clostridiales bacterium]|nr:YfhO family protein [Candidatus Crickella caballi]